MPPTLTLSVKWNKVTLDKLIVDVDEFESFKQEIEKRTGVSSQRQKLMVKGFGMVKDQAGFKAAVEKGKVQDNGQIMLMGTADKDISQMAEQAAQAKASVVFAEDLPDDDIRAGGTVNMAAGLRNLGNTCYLNSCLQALGSVQDLRNAALDLDGDISPEGSASLTSMMIAQMTAQQQGGPHAAETAQAALAEAAQRSQMNGDAERNVAIAFRNLLRELKETNKASVDPAQLLLFFRIAYPQFAARGEGGVPMQQDAEEAYSQLVSVLQRELPGDPITSLFGGKLEESRQLKGATVDSAMDQSVNRKLMPFDRLRCHIDKDTNFLMDGLKASMQEDIELDNQIYEKHSRIAELPRYLTVQFVRFFWKAGKSGPAMGLAGDLKSGGEGGKAKILRPVEFPRHLDLFPLCTDELKEKLKPGRAALQQAEDAIAFNKAETDTYETALSKTSFNEPNITGEYELFAVISHKGRSADSGHYVAWVKDDARPKAPPAKPSGKISKGEPDNDAWLLFDDEDVIPVRWEPDVKQLSGKGGGDWHIAYLCLYRSRNPPAAATTAAQTSSAAAASGDMDTSS